MAALLIRFLNASREPLDDDVDVTVTAVRTNTEKFRKKGHDASKNLRVTGLPPNEPYLVRGFPMRHRPVGQFVFAPSGQTAGDVDLYCPADPQRVTPKFPDYDDLDEALQDVLQRSTLERDVSAPPLPVAAEPGRSLYDGLDPIARAGLLNLYCKMTHVSFGGADAWSFVQDLYRVRGDRIFVNVNVDFRDRVKSDVASGLVTAVSGSLHKPPSGFDAAGSFKTRDRYGNLQLTFFSSTAAPLVFRVDADIDDAAGIEHAFQVLDHAITDAETHPFDIHEILTFFQRLETGYTLTV